ARARNGRRAWRRGHGIRRCLPRATQRGRPEVRQAVDSDRIRAQYLRACVSPSRRAVRQRGFGGWSVMCAVGIWRIFTAVALVAWVATPVVAQEPDATTREAAIEQAQAEKVK